MTALQVTRRMTVRNASQEVCRRQLWLAVGARARGGRCEFQV